MKRILVVMLVCLSLASAAAAQPPSWTSKVRLGKRIHLTTHTCEVISGLVEHLTRDAIVVATPIGPRAVPYNEVRRAEKRDAQWTGAVIGAAVGAMIGMAVNILDRDWQQDFSLPPVLLLE